jgi:hypothetical protein
MNLRRLQSVLAHGGDHLGDLVFWTLQDARVECSILEQLWRDAGLDAGLLPEPPSADRAFKQAAREAQVGQRDRLIRMGLDTESELVFAVVREHCDDLGNVTYRQEARVRLDRTTETISSDASAHDIVQGMVANYRVLRTTHTADDIRRSMVRCLALWSAVTLRDHGGVYWVPRPYAAELRQLQSAVEHVGTSRVHVLPIHQSQDADRALGEIATASLEAELAQLQAEINAFVSAPPERASTLQRRFEAFEALRNRARLYRSVLSLQVTDLDRQLDHMTATVDGLLAQKAA